MMKKLHFLSNYWNTMDALGDSLSGHRGFVDLCPYSLPENKIKEIEERRKERIKSLGLTEEEYYDQLKLKKPFKPTLNNFHTPKSRNLRLKEWFEEHPIRDPNEPLTKTEREKINQRARSHRAELKRRGLTI